MRDRLEAAILAKVPDAVIHGRGAKVRAPHITNVSVPGTDSESMLMALDLRGIGCSAGSACQSGSITPSHVLSAIGVTPEIAGSAIRMSIGCLTTDACIERIGDVFGKLVEKARGASTLAHAG
jgi:cysteine desulfurase